MRELGYRMNPIARGLKTSRTGTVGFLTPEIANHFFMLIARWVETELKEHGYDMIVCNSDESIEGEREGIRLLTDRRVDGLILIPSSDEGGHFRALDEVGIPAVLVDRTVRGFRSDSVLVDNEQGSYDAVDRMIRMGFRRIGFIGGDMKLTNARERYRGYRKALAEHRIAPEEAIIRFGDFHTESGYILMKELMGLPDPPRQVFIANWFMHVGATKYLAEHRERAPRDLFVSGFDDMELTPILSFSHLTVAQPVREIGRSAARTLLRRIRGDREDFPLTLRLAAEVKIY